MSHSHRLAVPDTVLLLTALLSTQSLTLASDNTDNVTSRAYVSSKHTTDIVTGRLDSD